MKKVFVAAEGPVGDALRTVMGATAQVVGTVYEADVVVAFKQENVLRALEMTTLPVWQLVYGDPVEHKRVRRFDLLGAGVATLMAEAAQ